LYIFRVQTKKLKTIINSHKQKYTYRHMNITYGVFHVALKNQIHHMKKTLALFASALVLIFASCSNMKHEEHNDSLEKNKEAVKKVYEAFESGNTDSLGNYIAENADDHSLPPEVKSTGLQAVKEVIAMHHTAFSDLKVSVINMSAEGDMVYAHHNMKGINNGPWGAMSATGKSIDVNGVDIIRFENGKAVEHWGYWEEAKMMKQLGMMPEAPMHAGETKEGGIKGDMKEMKNEVKEEVKEMKEKIKK
jgi:predicted ester cyclase